MRAFPGMTKETGYLFVSRYTGYSPTQPDVRIRGGGKEKEEELSDRMKIARLSFLLFCLAAILLCSAPPVANAQGAGTAASGSAPPTAQSHDLSQVEKCEQVIALLQQQRSLLTRELAQIKRELAALRESMSQPGLLEVFAGIGYILGFAGIAFFVHSKKSSRNS